MCTQAHFECMHVSIHTYTSVASADPLWGQEHQCPCGFLPYGIMLGRYFCLLGWLLDMVFIWIGNLFSFESIYSTEKRRSRTRRGVAIRNVHPSALTWRTWVDSSLEEESGPLTRCKHHWYLFMYLFGSFIYCHVATKDKTLLPHQTQRYLCVFVWAPFFCLSGLNNRKKLFFWRSLPQQRCQGRANKMSSKWNES